MEQYYKSQALKVLYDQIFLLIHKLNPSGGFRLYSEKLSKKMSTYEALKSH